MKIWGCIGFDQRILYVPHATTRRTYRVKTIGQLKMQNQVSLRDLTLLWLTPS